MSDDKDSIKFNATDGIKKFTFKLSVDQQKSLTETIKEITKLQENLIKNPEVLTMAQTIEKIDLKKLFNQSIKLTNSLTPLTLVPIKKDVIRIQENVVKVLKSEQKEIEAEKIESEEKYEKVKNQLEEINKKLTVVMTTQESHGRKLKAIKKSSKETKEKTGKIEVNTRPKTQVPIAIGIGLFVALIAWLIL